MALAIDSVESGATGHNVNTVGGSGTLVWAFNNAAGTLLVLGISVNQNSGGVPTLVSAPTYNGVAMTLGGSSSVSGNFVANLFYYLENPATGSHNVSINFQSGGGSPSYLSCNAGCISFTGAVPINPLFNSTSNNGNSAAASVSLTNTFSGDYTLALIGTGTGLTSATAPATLTWKAATSGNDGADETGMAYYKTPGGTAAINFVVSSDLWAVGGIEVSAPATIMGQACL